MDIGSIGIIGGTGKQGSGLAKYWYKAGLTVAIGSRSTEKGEKVANEIKSELVDNSNVGIITGGDNKFAANSDIIVLAIPFDQVDPLITPLKDLLEDKVIIDVTVNLKFGKIVSALQVDGKSSYEMIRGLFPNSQVVACFKTISSYLLQKGKQIHQVDFHQSLDANALDIASKLAIIIGLTPVKLVGKTHAHTVERMVALAIQLNKTYPGSHIGYNLSDLIKS